MQAPRPTAVKKNCRRIALRCAAVTTNAHRGGKGMQPLLRPASRLPANAPLFDDRVEPGPPALLAGPSVEEAGHQGGGGVGLVADHPRHGLADEADAEVEG